MLQFLPQNTLEWSFYWPTDTDQNIYQSYCGFHDAPTIWGECNESWTDLDGLPHVAGKDQH